MKKGLAAVIGSFMATVFVTAATAAGPMLSNMAGGNKHNLSSASAAAIKASVNPGDYRSDQVCVFCHTPHNATPQTVLWNRKDTTVTFGHYSSTSLVIDNASVKPTSQYGEPNGSSRLCLSCHDGVNGLGLVRNGTEIAFGVNSLITGNAKFTPAKVKTGHHPVSFVYNGAVQGLINSAGKAAPYNGTYRFAAPVSDPDVLKTVRLDRQMRMQCTTCHNPHQNQSDDAATWPPANTRKIVPFWVYHKAGNSAAQDHDAVCFTCHDFKDPGPWP